MPSPADKPIVEVADIATETALERVSKTTAAGRGLPMNRHPRLGFSLEEYLRRYEHVLTRMRERGLAALCIRSPENITWLSGYETPGYYKYHCVVVPKDGEPVFLVRDFEWINSPEFAWSTKIAKVFDWDHPPSVTFNVLQQLGLGSGKRIGVEKHGFFYTVDEHETLLRELAENTYFDASQILWDTRMIKSQEEIEVIRKSARLVDLAMQAGWDATRPGASGDEINAMVNKALFENGGEYMGLPPFVLAGDRSCLPHQTGGANKLADDDLMYFEISASKHRYTAALMRTIFVGNPKDEWVRAAEACIGAVEAALETIRPGVTPHDVDVAARAVTQKAGFGDYHRNRLGYSIGISYPPDWGEGEIISLRQEEYRPLAPGMTFHMPPLCLKYREYGIGFSESIVVTESGCERFSNLSREIVIKS